MDQLVISTISSRIFRYRYYFFFALILIGYTCNLFIDIMEIDAAQYAAISGEMAETGSYLQVYQRGQDYLDKPPLLFWIASLGIGLFGHTSFAYKILPVFFLVISLFATYRFTKLWYDHRTAMLAVLIAGTTQAYALMSNDIRTDGLLTAFVMLSMWSISSYLLTKDKLALFAAGLCIGGAMLAKGPLGLIIPTAAIGGHLLVARQWKKIFDPNWLWLLPVVAIVLAPMCYGLYTQFDLHPEKEVYGLKGPSGLRFYFWTQSFGRITGESDWANNTPWYYFLQTMLWDMQPWILLFIPAMWSRLRQFIKRQNDPNEKAEWISLCGFVLPFIALSFSSYKLPHYIFPVFPFAAIIIANYLLKRVNGVPKWMDVMQIVVIHLLDHCYRPHSLLGFSGGQAMDCLLICLLSSTRASGGGGKKQRILSIVSYCHRLPVCLFFNWS
jgi:4-amino-4-deoxy-L-arabinose transferase-like glycosyltransferase